MIRSKACARRWLLPALGLVLGAAACAGQDTTAAETADVAVSGGAAISPSISAITRRAST